MEASWCFFLINFSYYTTVRRQLWKCARNSKTDDLFEERLFRKYHIPHEFEFLNPFKNPVLLKNLWLQNGKNWLKGHSRQILKVILTMATFLNIYNYFIVSSEQWSESLIFMGKCFPNYLILHSLPTTYIFSSLLISPLPEDHEIKKGIRCPLAYFFTAAAFIGFICSRQNFQFGTQSLPFGTTTIWGTEKKKKTTCCYVLWNHDTRITPIQPLLSVKLDLDETIFSWQTQYSFVIVVFKTQWTLCPHMCVLTFFKKYTQPYDFGVNTLKYFCFECWHFSCL